jgi:hypothetical protein
MPGTLVSCAATVSGSDRRRGIGSVRWCCRVGRRHDASAHDGSGNHGRDDRHDRHAATPATTEPAPVPVLGAELLGAELVGRWAHYDVVAYEDDVLKTLIISYGFNDFTEVDGQIVDQASFCFSEQRTDQPIRTSLSDAATQAIQPPPATLEVDVVDDVLRIRRPATPTPVGIRLDDPFNEPLPTDPNDPRIVDDDGDGQAWSDGHDRGHRGLHRRAVHRAP